MGSPFLLGSVMRFHIKRPRAECFLKPGVFENDECVSKMLNKELINEKNLPPHRCSQVIGSPFESISFIKQTSVFFTHLFLFNLI